MDTKKTLIYLICAVGSVLLVLYSLYAFWELLVYNMSHNPFVAMDASYRNPIQYFGQGLIVFILALLASFAFIKMFLGEISNR